jgi:hypothetical protein
MLSRDSCCSVIHFQKKVNVFRAGNGIGGDKGYASFYDRMRLFRKLFSFKSGNDKAGDSLRLSP